MDYKIYPNVKIGKNSQIGDFAVVGYPPKGKKEGKLKTVIGKEALIRSHTVIYAGNIIGDKFQTGHGVNIREKNKIGNNVSIGTHSMVGHHVEIGNNVRIHSNAFIPEYSVLEENSWVGPCVVFTNTLHPLCPQAKNCLKGPHLKKGAKIGANATLLPDITIGEKALIGAGAMVTKDVAAKKVVVDNPARVIKDISKLTCPHQLIKKPYQD